MGRGRRVVVADSRIESEQTHSYTMLGVAFLVALVAARCLIGITSDPHFDVDPLQNPLPWFGIGPAGVLLFSVLALLAGTLILLGERASGRGFDRVLFLAAMLPLVAIVIHGSLDAADLWRGIDWFTAAFSAVALAHAMRAPGIRATVLGGLLGVVALLSVQGAYELLVEHPAMVAFFEGNRDAMLRSFGWEPGSVQAALYERRLQQPEASGWFGLANLFSALMVVGLVALLGCLNRRTSSGGTMLMVLVAIGLAGLVALNGSKGALVAAVIGILMICAPACVSGLKASWRTLPGRLAVGMLLLVLLVVVVRGQSGDAFLGDERSLLFRWHYLLGAVRMVTHHPWLGVGPDGFQEAYLLLKPELSPEDPVSAHNMLLDWLAAFGVFGVSWIFLLAMLALRGGRTEEDAVGATDSAGATWLVPVGLAVACGFGVLVELPTLSPLAIVIRTIGLALAVTIAVVVRDAMLRLPSWRQGWCLGAILAVLLALGSIDMLFMQAGTVAIAWAFVGACATAGRCRPRRFDPVIVMLPAALAVWVVFAALIPEQRVAARTGQAAMTLRVLGALPEEVAEVPAGLAPWSRADALASVREASLRAASRLPEDAPLKSAMVDFDYDRLASGSNDPRLITSDLVRTLLPVARSTAVAELDAASDIDDRNLRPVWAMIEQLRRLALAVDERSGRASLLKAVVRLDDAMDRNPSARSAIAAAWVLADSASIENAPDHDQVIEAFRVALSLSPHDPELLVGLADAARLGGDRELEQDALQAALLKDDARALDPLVQFPPARRAELEARLQSMNDPAG